MRKIRYFAYGSNLNLDQMARRCPDAEVVGTVRLDGYQLAFAGVATILPDPGSHVDGVLWEISAADERRLDVYEGFPRLYGKESVTVTDKAGNTHEVMAYTMNPPYRDVPEKPGASYLYGILAGCEQNGIDPKSVYDAVERTKQEVEKQQERSGKRRGRQDR